MKKVRILSVLLLIVSVAAFVIFNMYRNMIIDNNPPVVTCDKEEITVPIDITEEELLKGVNAEDKRSGDVSDTLVIESMSAFSEDGKRVVTYAAVDESMNVGRAEQTVIYEGYEKPRFAMNDSLCFAIGEKVDLLKPVTVSSVLDGDLTDNIKYNLVEVIDKMSPGNYPIEYRVTDSGGNVVYLSTYVEICDSSYSGIDVDLNEYLVYVKKGAAFDAGSYYAGADREGSLQIQSNVNTGETGTYFVDYIVNGSGINGKSRLVVVVE